MSRFIQFHVLKTHAPSNLNRDELGRPKTAMFGGAKRLRISSQCFKRAIRESDLFTSQFSSDRLGHQTRDIGNLVYEKFKDDYDQEKLLSAIAAANHALEEGSLGSKRGKGGWLSSKVEKKAKKIVEAFEKNGGEALRTNQVMKLHDYEVRGYEKAVKYMCQEGLPENKKEGLLVLHYLTRSEEPSHAVDIALFGRMMTSNPSASMDGASMVSHAMSVDEVETEHDYFTAVDDFATGTGSAHNGTKEFISGTLYFFVAIDVDRLVENLEGDEELAQKAVYEFGKALALVNPGGNQTTMASQNPADYLRVEVTETHPCSLHTAFEVPVKSNPSEGVMRQAIDRIETTAAQYAHSYGEDLKIEASVFNRFEKGRLSEALELVKKCF